MQFVWVCIPWWCQRPDNFNEKECKWHHIDNTMHRLWWAWRKMLWGHLSLLWRAVTRADCSPLRRTQMPLRLHTVRNVLWAWDHTGTAAACWGGRYTVHQQLHCWVRLTQLTGDNLWNDKQDGTADIWFKRKSITYCNLNFMTIM